MKAKKQNEAPQLSFADFCEGMGSDKQELSKLGQKKWDLVKLYLFTRLKEGGQFTYEDLAKRAVRFACIVSNTIEGMRGDLHKEYTAKIEAQEKAKREEAERKTEYERSSPETKERIYQKVLREAQGLAYIGGVFGETDEESMVFIENIHVPYTEYKKLKERAEAEVATYTPTQCYEKGMMVSYADLDAESQEDVYQRWLNEKKKPPYFISDSIQRKIRLAEEELEVFCERRNEMLNNMPIFEWTQWGERVFWNDLNEEEREKLHQQYLGGDRVVNTYKKGNVLKNYNNYIIPKVVIDAWREEYNQRKKEEKGDWTKPRYK